MVIPRDSFAGNTCMSQPRHYYMAIHIHTFHNRLEWLTAQPWAAHDSRTPTTPEWIPGSCGIGTVVSFPCISEQPCNGATCLWFSSWEVDCCVAENSHFPVSAGLPPSVAQQWSLQACLLSRLQHLVAAMASCRTARIGLSLWDYFCYNLQ